MAHHAMLSDPAARGKLVPNKRLAGSLLSVLAARGSKDSKWVSNHCTAKCAPATRRCVGLPPS